MNEPTQAEIEVAAQAQHEWTEANRARLGGYAPCAFDELSTTVKNMRWASMRAALTAAAQVRESAATSENQLLRAALITLSVDAASAVGLVCSHRAPVSAFIPTSAPEPRTAS